MNAAGGRPLGVRGENCTDEAEEWAAGEGAVRAEWAEATTTGARSGKGGPPGSMVDGAPCGGTLMTRWSGMAPVGRNPTGWRWPVWSGAPGKGGTPTIAA